MLQETSFARWGSVFSGVFVVAAIVRLAPTGDLPRNTITQQSAEETRQQALLQLLAVYVALWCSWRNGDSLAKREEPFVSNFQLQSVVPTNVVEVFRY